MPQRWSRLRLHLARPWVCRGPVSGDVGPAVSALGLRFRLLVLDLSQSVLQVFEMHPLVGKPQPGERSCLQSRFDARPRIEYIAQCVADEIEGEYGEHDSGSRKED